MKQFAQPESGIHAIIIRLLHVYVNYLLYIIIASVPWALLPWLSVTRRDGSYQSVDSRETTAEKRQQNFDCYVLCYRRSALLTLFYASAYNGEFAAVVIALAVGDEVEVKSGGDFVAGIVGKIPGHKSSGRA